MEVPDGYQVVSEPRGRGVVRADVAGAPLGDWWREGPGLPAARGRGGVAVLEGPAGSEFVARSYRRGGVLRRLNDRFLDADRAERELWALVALGRAGVPTVAPVAALRRRRGLFWRLRLVTELVRGALPLPAFVGAHPEHRRAAVREAGRVTRLAFEAGLDHVDLHPDNMLVSEESAGVVVRLIDLDRAEIRREVSPAMRDRMLLRLARYLERHRRSLPVTLRRVDVLRFLAGLGYDRRSRRQESSRLGPLLARQVARHRWTWTEQG